MQSIQSLIQNDIDVFRAKQKRLSADGAQLWNIFS